MSNKARILVHIEGGVVQGVFSTSPDVEVTIRDADIEGSEHECAEEGTLHEDGDGYRYKEYDEYVYPWSNLETQPYENPIKPEDV